MTAMDLCLELTFTGDALDREVVAQVEITGGTAGNRNSTCVIMIVD